MTYVLYDVAVVIFLNALFFREMGSAMCVVVIV